MPTISLSPGALLGTILSMLANVLILLVQETKELKETNDKAVG